MCVCLRSILADLYSSKLSVTEYIESSLFQIPMPFFKGKVVSDMDFILTSNMLSDPSF